ncbi:MAG: aminopeptidase [Desulfatiglans sp.]|jgi:aminopeptidase|nr:aminopeptidase [Thermodesulfobacteriota bacterium]MEE4352668.1 aminopeptidase [Desulfatiglans sp.]
MLTKRQMDRYADVLLWGLKTARKGIFKKNDIVMVRFDHAALKLADILHGKLLDMGLNPVIRLGLTSVMEHHFYEKSNNRQLVFQGPWEKTMYENLNGSIHLHAPDSLTHLYNVDPKKIGKALVARKPLRDILWKREEIGTYGWTLCQMSTSEQANKAGLSEKQHINQIIRACYLDKADPVKEWKTLFKNAQAIKKWLNSMEIKYLHIESDSIDLRVKPGQKRRWVGISGHNIPSFELFLSPDWRGTEGVYYADQPSYRSGNYVEGVRLLFRRGRAVEFKAKKGSDFLAQQIGMDRGASRVGEFSLTDKRFSRINRFMASTLFDENYGGRYGNCHLAIGSSYSDTYDGDPAELTKEMKKDLGLNDSALHWDLVNTENKRVMAHLSTGGKTVIYEDGIFRF